MGIETRHDRIAWADISKEVQAKLQFLRLAWTASERDLSPGAHRKMVEDIYFPLMRTLAEFCESIKEPDAEDC